MDQVTPEGHVQLLSKVSDKMQPLIRNDHLRKSMQT
jgi:hypothetical protein